MKNTAQITEGNKLIAEFMDYDLALWKDEELKFNSDWNWLMEVVKKIDSLYDLNSDDEFIENFDKVAQLPIFSKIEDVYTAVVEFINWYNNQKNS